MSAVDCTRVRRHSCGTRSTAQHLPSTRHITLICTVLPFTLRSNSSPTLLLCLQAHRWWCGISCTTLLCDFSIHDYCRTTSSWTLPFTQAVLVNPDLTYGLVEATVNGYENKYVIAKEQIDDVFVHKIKVNGYRVVTSFLGKELKV